MLDTIAEGIADAMTALHDGTITAFQFIGRQRLSTVEIAGEAVGDVGKEGVFKRKEERLRVGELCSGMSGKRLVSSLESATDLL